MVTLICAEKAPSRGSEYMELRENFYALRENFYAFVFRLLFICLFNNIFTFQYLQCLIYIS